MQQKQWKHTQGTRRAFLTAGSLGAIGLLLRPLWRVREVQAAAPDAETVTIAQFSPSGKALGLSNVPTIRRTRGEWKNQLSPTAFDVTREAGTERPYTGSNWDQHEVGFYRCICCDTALFSSSTKFDSGTGWPSFYQPIARENVRQSGDTSFGMERTAVSCARCAAHLGHVFDDGPRPTGLRYCMNGVAMSFKELA